MAAVSTGRRNTGLKPHCLVFGPEGFAGASAELAQSLLAMSERLPRKVGSRGKPLSKQASEQSVEQDSQYFHQ